MGDPGAGNVNQGMPGELLGRAKQSVRWVFWGRFALQFVALGYTVVLARLLSPASFGIYGLAFVILQFVNQIESLRIESALIQIRALPDRMLSESWTFAIVFGCLATAILYSLSGVLASAFGFVELGPLLRIGSFVFVIRASFLPARVLLKRSLRFKALTVVEVLRIVPSGAIAILLAWQGQGALALLAYYLLRELIGGAALILIARHRILPAFGFAGFRSLVPFGISSSLSEVSVYLLFNLPDLFVGWFIGASPLGEFRQGVALVSRPISFVDDILNKLAFPVLSRAWGNDELVRTSFLRAVKILVVVSAPIFSLTFLLSDELVSILYGDQWDAAVPIVQLFAAIGIARILQPLNSSIFHAGGVPRTEARINLVALLLLGFLLAFLRPTDIVSVARIVAIAYVLMALLGLHFSTLLAGTSWASLLVASRHSIIAMGVAATVGVVTKNLASTFPLVPRTVTVLLVVVVIYSAILWILDRRFFADARRLLLSRDDSGIAQPKGIDD